MNIGDLVQITLGVPSSEDKHNSNGIVGIITEMSDKYCIVKNSDGTKHALSIKQLKKFE